MRVAWATDVHLNFLDAEGFEDFALRISALLPQAVFLTGDISEAPALEEHLLSLDARLGVPIYFVLGNHDFYGGSIAAVRASAEALARRSPRLCWLPAAGVVTLPGGHALVGQDGWGDGRVGNFAASPILLNDWQHIEEFRAAGAMFNVPARLAKLRTLGDEAARNLERDLSSALERHRSVTVLTHVPPFEGACWHDGAVSNPDWLPWFTCEAVGRVLLEQAERHADRRIRVYCGHTHSPGRFAPRDNLIVYTGTAEYGAPTVVAIDLDAP